MCYTFRRVKETGIPNKREQKPTSKKNNREKEEEAEAEEKEQIIFLHEIHIVANRVQYSAAHIRTHRGTLSYIGTQTAESTRNTQRKSA